MSLVNAQAGIEMARCSQCDHDLIVKTQGVDEPEPIDGNAYCSNPQCKFSRQPYPMGKNVNEGKVASA